MSTTPLTELLSLLRLAQDRYFMIRRRIKGLTLVETLLAVVISALIMTAIIPFIRAVSTSWQAGSGKQEILQNGRTALEMITRYLKQAKRITGIPGSRGNYIKMRDGQDTYDIIFYHNVAGSPYYIGETSDIKDNDLVMRSNQGGTELNTMVAPSLTSLNFNFLKDDRSSAQKANQARTVEIETELQDPLDVISDHIKLQTAVVFRPDIKVTTPVWAIDGRLTANNLVEIANDKLVKGFNISTDSGDCLGVNPIDGSCWVADRNGRCVKKVSLDGELLVQLDSPFSRPVGISVNSVLLYNGRETVWVGDVGQDRVYRIYWTGSSWTVEEIGQFNNPFAVSVNPYEVINGRETCWVAETGRDRVHRVYRANFGWNSDYVTGFRNPRDVCVNPNENIGGRNTCWVADIGDDSVKKIYWRATSWSPRYVVISLGMGRRSDPRAVSVNTADNTCWVANSGSNSSVAKISASASSILFESSNFSNPYSVSVNPTDGTCWVADYNHNQLARLNADGDEEFRISNLLDGPVSVSVSPSP